MEKIAKIAKKIFEENPELSEKIAHNGIDQNAENQLRILGIDLNELDEEEKRGLSEIIRVKYCDEVSEFLLSGAGYY